MKPNFKAGQTLHILNFVDVALSIKHLIASKNGGAPSYQEVYDTIMERVESGLVSKRSCISKLLDAFEKTSGNKVTNTWEYCSGAMRHSTKYNRNIYGFDRLFSTHYPASTSTNAISSVEAALTYNDDFEGLWRPTAHFITSRFSDVKRYARYMACPSKYQLIIRLQNEYENGNDVYRV